MTTRSIRLTSMAAAALVMVTLDGCGGSPTRPAYDPDIPAEWAAAVTNPFFPLTAGTKYEYRGETDEGVEMIIIEVLAQTRNVNGVQATVVRDRVYVDGELVEDTDDWFAQDAAGNVWYLGEASKEIEDGEVVSTEGSWEWGVDGALPGIIMWADPAAHIDEAYRQEFARGKAEDWGRVISIGESVTVPYGSFEGCIRTEDWNALETDELENKVYCASIGLVFEELVEGGDERVELIAVTD